MLVSNKTYNLKDHPNVELKFKIIDIKECDSIILGIIPDDHNNFEKIYAENGICVTTNGSFENNYDLTLNNFFEKLKEFNDYNELIEN